MALNIRMVNQEIHYYRLFDGVGIMLLRLEMEAYTQIRIEIRLEVNFCVNGRFETSFSMRDRVLAEAGRHGGQLLRWLSRKQFGVLLSAGLLRGNLFWRLNRPPREIG